MSKLEQQAWLIDWFSGWINEWLTIWSIDWMDGFMFPVNDSYQWYCLYSQDWGYTEKIHQKVFNQPVTLQHECKNLLMMRTVNTMILLWSSRGELSFQINSSVLFTFLLSFECIFHLQEWFIFILRN